MPLPDHIPWIPGTEKREHLLSSVSSNSDKERIAELEKKLAEAQDTIYGLKEEIMRLKRR